MLERNPDIAIRVVGHADATGEPRYNQWLAERRANRVRSYLVEAGVSGSRIAVEAVGDTAPIGANDSDAGRASNRRAEIVLER